MSEPVVHELAAGRQGSIVAYRVSPNGPGLSAWRAVKIVYANQSGKTSATKPHNILKEVLILEKVSHPNVCLPSTRLRMSSADEALYHQIIQLENYGFSPSSKEHQLLLPLLSLPLSDLHALPLDPDITRSLSFQLLLALAHLHSLGIAHRDVNPSNLMIDDAGRLKVVDFGMAWMTSDDTDLGEEWKEGKDDMCCQVGTRTYRAPELLFGPRVYDACAIDLWAAGCVLAEFFTPLSKDEALEADYDELEGARAEVRRQHLFDDSFGELGLAASVFQLFGTPTVTSWPDFHALPDAGKIQFQSSLPKALSTVLETQNCDGQFVDLLESLLQLSPGRRMSAVRALRHPYCQHGIVMPTKAEVWYGVGQDRRVVGQPISGGLREFMREELDAVSRRFEGME
ncbi:hypothetical protein P7C73_g3819, partial [Tremellales sp. Uapishka_1]